VGALTSIGSHNLAPRLKPRFRGAFVLAVGTSWPTRRLPGHMYSRSDDYRRRGIEAQNRAAAAADTTIRSAFDELARGWFALAEQTDWLDKCYRDPQREKE
jgi:hypothetical protein